METGLMPLMENAIWKKTESHMETAKVVLH